ncbi:phosphoenolpyruvate synthase [Marinilongibacter aquaticus]|uniref:phosphoenolpyruvate synthase n=1 Tax=Marinilongibacter aquaticus TaxID=2975157 RepID=UPI0021BDE89D|nr:phosphoenolpyruvate synthase [Marinilongibacter aquaticus]UBM58571.1 phosphoenolpyruvate synthase [Marinilongibacter aquaticus]
MKKDILLTLGLEHIQPEMHALFGHKATQLAALIHTNKYLVPNGFCLSTECFQNTFHENREYQKFFHEIRLLSRDQSEERNVLAEKLRTCILDGPIPSPIEEAVHMELCKFDRQQAFAIRSSGTAEDLPAASFAGQYDSFLNVRGETQVLQHIRRCWASLFSERAVAYRQQNDFSQNEVGMAVLVQCMVSSKASGVIFTADPITSQRNVFSIDAGFGLGESFVSGTVSADNYRIKNGEITHKKMARKAQSIFGKNAGGTTYKNLHKTAQETQTLSDEEILQLAEIGQSVAQFFGTPQDIEWSLHDAKFYILQSRPITTLYPVPETSDTEKHVYVSVGHQQMMTDAMKPLGLSLWQLVALRPMYEAGSRLFVDVAPLLATANGQKMLLHSMGHHDPLIQDALSSLLNRGDFIPQMPELAENMPINTKAPEEIDPTLVQNLIAKNEQEINDLKQVISTKSGPALVEFIYEDIQNLKKSLVAPENTQAIGASMQAANWLNQKMQLELNEVHAADTLSQAVPYNVTAEMGLALLDVADCIRPYPKLVEHLQKQAGDNFMDELDHFEGGEKVREEIEHFLLKYGMRCPGEIDITNTRWAEKPEHLLPILLSNIRNFSSGEAKRRLAQGKREAQQKELDLLARLAQLPNGKEKAIETQRVIRILRQFAGYREYPKYAIVSRLFLYKKALLKELQTLFSRQEDLYYLRFEELSECLRSKKWDYQLIAHRQEQHKIHEKLQVPRVMTSDGEIIRGTYKRDKIPANAFIGLPVSSGIVEGTARVIHRMENAELKENDILVTRFTDPSWTPLFVAIRGLITEVGGLMTHGSVIAREYGLPAIVGVDKATERIKDGQRIRLNGTEGYIEIL